LAEVFYSLLFVGAGVVGLYFSIRSLLNPAFAKTYAETGPKAWLGSRASGAENLSMMNGKVFLPLGGAISLGLVLLGIQIWF
jgi:hypothetical protein